MKKTYRIYSTIPLLVLTLFISCKKDFLDAKPSTSILQPQTLDDFQGLLENVNPTLSPVLATMAADEYYFISYELFQSTPTVTERNSYIWAKDLFGGEVTGGNWRVPYSSVFYANSVLAGLDKIDKDKNDEKRYNSIKGWALYARAFAYYELVSNFSPAYDAATATTELGVPIKLSPSVDELQPRATVQQTYEQILTDLKNAIPLLDPDLPIANRNRPSQVAGHALLARIYLSMRNYQQAEEHADSSLELYKKLIDYNSVSPTNIQPFNMNNDELIFYKAGLTNTYLTALTRVALNKFITINPAIISSYKENDLRPGVYFAKLGTGGTIMKMMYNGAAASVASFTGLATDEVYLVKAECAARRNDLETSMRYLNDLLINRYKTNTFSPLVATGQSDALDKVLSERRKELIWRGLRWSDLKRLNKEGANITLTRELNGVTYTLPPNDLRYVFPIPDDEISLSGIQQNPR
ncbi:RagB/SusD family nutrient uptake outer membrane protein [Pedobacter sp. ISL-68]|uniref:RagB/SusD family nutrient uptake outer membrane protein n=1 Tax=unclassified Pedobacter TaxID=2628915 RepID=UPI001BE7E6C0|nr:MULTISPECIES: RagB/SusD family nutrient uptake outer membrane protein [unclassified Pedobacter]MBT2561710.1 RagB/SusD family nutrient uptake outer membrane protein [Pedobacter sp. ISL-64]MBT2591098.1 RagB/SusD family nutrient uptake outer membrane protein [Pedobacter sp. ISL-68]